MIKCPKCNETIGVNVKMCPYCESFLGGSPLTREYCDKCGGRLG